MRGAVGRGTAGAPRARESAGRRAWRGPRRAGPLASRRRRRPAARCSTRRSCGAPAADPSRRRAGIGDAPGFFAGAAAGRSASAPPGRDTNSEAPHFGHFILRPVGGISTLFDLVRRVAAVALDLTMLIPNRRSVASLTLAGAEHHTILCAVSRVERPRKCDRALAAHAAVDRAPLRRPGRRCRRSWPSFAPAERGGAAAVRVGGASRAHRRRHTRPLRRADRRRRARADGRRRGRVARPRAARIDTPLFGTSDAGATLINGEVAAARSPATRRRR